jgi:hypothetical protein
MKGFDEIASQVFQRSDNGTWIYFPRTRFFSGYEVPSDGRKLDLQQQFSQFLELAMWVDFAVLMLAGSFGHLIAGAMGLEVLMLVATALFARHASRGLVKSSVRFDPERQRRLFVESRSVRRLLAMEALCLVMTFFAIYALELQPQLWTTLLPGAIFLAFCTVAWSRMMKLKFSTRAMQTHATD